MENKRVKKVFRSRISVLLLGLLLLIFIPTAIPIIKFMIISSLFIMGGTLLFIILLFSGMRYVILDNKLYVKILWCISIEKVDISSIISAERSYNILSSPAASLKRLRIGFKKGKRCQYLLISPVKEMEFIEELKAVNPDINVNIPVKEGAWCIQDLDI